jgi:hypothetical protein
MKKFIIYLLLYLLPVLVFAVLLEIVLRRIPNDYVYKKNYWDTHSHEIETLILGSSHAYYGIDPVYFSTNTFNASHISQSLEYDYELLKQYDTELTNLKTVIIPVSYFTLWGKLSNGQESRRVKNYVLYYGMKNNNNLRYRFELSSNRLDTNLRRIISCLLRRGNNITCSEKGWGTDYNSQKAKDLEETGKTAAERHTRKDICSVEKKELFNENISILDSIIDLCRKHNAELFLFTPPAYYTYRQRLNEEQLNKTVETVNAIANKYSNCTYQNMMADSSFVAADYYDADHLSETGAKKLSVLINKYVHNH